MTLDLTKLVMTRDGRKVELITTSGREPYSIIGYVDDGVVEWKNDGRRLSSHETRMDLVNVPEPKRVVDFWVNVYPYNYTNVATHSTKEDATHWADDTRIDCIHIRWTEGNGAGIVND